MKPFVVAVTCWHREPTLELIPSATAVTGSAHPQGYAFGDRGQYTARLQ